MRNLLFLLGLAAASVAAQPAPTTLAGWERDVRIGARDRLHAYGGLFFDRGLFRQLTPGMDHEYELDLATIGFTPREDGRWLSAPVAFRLQAGSISRARFAHRVDVRARASLGPGALWLDAAQEEDLQASRLFSEVGGSLRYGRHEAGLAQTFGHYKPDLDLTLFYTHHADAGTFTARVEVLDVANDFIFEVLGTDASLEDTVRAYRAVPLLLSVAAASPADAALRAEAYAGFHPTVTADVSVRSSQEAFAFADGMAYAAALVEQRIGRARAGAFARATFSRARRTEPDGTGYHTFQRLVEGGLTAAVAWPRLALDGTGTVGTYVDEQDGTHFAHATVPRAFRYREDRLLARLSAETPLVRGVALGAVYLVQSRRGTKPLPYEGYLRFPPSSPNGRLTMALHLRHARADFALGGSFDLGGDPFFDDGRGLTRYDGAFVRLAVVP